MATDNTGMAPDKATPQPRQYATPNGVFDNVPAIDYPHTPGFTPAEYVPVGGVILADGDIVYNANRRTARLKVRNTGDRPVQVGSHLHFFEANRYLEFDREAAYGCHLNIPATTAVRFEPGEEKEVEVVTFAGKRRVIGFNDLVDGYTGLEDTPTYYPERIRAFARMKELGFKNVSADDADAMYNQSEVDNTKKPS